MSPTCYLLITVHIQKWNGKYDFNPLYLILKRKLPTPHSYTRRTDAYYAYIEVLCA